MLKNNCIIFLLLIAFCCFFSGCDPEEETFSLNIEFKHFVSDSEIIYGNDNMIYMNEAGNIYSVRRLLYVLSDICLYFSDGSSLALNGFIFVNTDDANTLSKTINDLPGLCNGISFRLGFSSEKNIDNEYINAEDNFHLSMLWPNLNGTDLAFQGGYHYMKLEGKYLNETLVPEELESFYNTHTGPTNGEDFSISYPEFNFFPSENISIEMNVNNWYNDPIYNIENFGPAIMANIDAQTNLYANGLNVFYVESE